MTISVAVQHGGDDDPFRRNCVNDIRKAIDAPVAVCKDPERRGSLYSLIRCMQTHTDAEWHLTLQDDIEILSDDLLTDLEHIAEHIDHGAVTLFAPRQELTRIPYGTIVRAGGFWGQANLFHKTFVKAFLDWVVPRRYLVQTRIGDDRVTSAFANEHDIPVYTVNPSLVEHAGHDRSMFGHGAGLRPRTARTHYNEQPEWTLDLQSSIPGIVTMTEIHQAVQKRLARQNKEQ